MSSSYLYFFRTLIYFFETNIVTYNPVLHSIEVPPRAIAVVNLDTKDAKVINNCLIIISLIRLII